jgi:hypothetical protein
VKTDRWYRVILVIGLAAFLCVPLTRGQLRLKAEHMSNAADSLVDVFPLLQGNEWKYRYFTEDGIWPGGNPGQSSTDSGEVTYLIVGYMSSKDSTWWQLQVFRRLVRHEIDWYKSRDTTFPIRDTSFVDLIERKQGQHQVYMHGDPNLIRFDVFPFTRDFVDTTLVYRYRGVGAGDTTVFLSCVHASPSPTFRSTFTFKKGVGLIRNRFDSGTVDAWAITDHYLLSSTITSVHEPQGTLPLTIHLDQNYPNPFNPTTTIRYALPARSQVTLTVFNTLGQQLTTLVNEVQEAGYHDVRFDGSGLASGVYFYRLRAGVYVATKRLIVVR